MNEFPDWRWHTVRILIVVVLTAVIIGVWKVLI